MDDLFVRRGLVIPGGELRETASRSSGPGGQHVNKSNTRVTLRWNAAESAALSESQRRRVLRRLETRTNREGEVLVHASKHRSRARNREHARQRLAELVREALARPRPRVPTRPSAGSRERKLAAKRRRATTKQRRGRVRPDDDG